MEASANGSGGMVPFAALFADVDAEFAATRRLLERFPDEHAGWRPHDKSMSAGALASHIASTPELGRMIAAQPEWNVEETPYDAPKVGTAADLLALFDKSSKGARQALDGLTPESLDHTWRLRNGDTVYFEGPRGLLLRQFLVSHTSHHRGQLTVYYRLLDVPVPGMYGPTADEM